MAPILKVLEDRDVPFNLLDTGQHAELTDQLLRQFDLQPPDITLRSEHENIRSFLQALIWVIKSLWRVVFQKAKICEDWFKSEGGICLIHGDTLSTLLSLLYAKRCGLRVAHVEAGLRSYHLLDPFPEEIIRLIVMRFSDILFAPSDWAVSNLKELGYSEKMVPIGGNTIVDALKYALSENVKEKTPGSPYVVVTIHRVETIYSKSRLERVVGLLTEISQDFRVLFVLHPPTEDQLKRFKLFDKLLENSAVELLPLQSYFRFISLIKQSEFVITDGGSIQEETSALNIPCLIMRTRTERDDGLGKNAFVSAFDPDRIDSFLNDLQSVRSSEHAQVNSPSQEIVDYLLQREI